MRANPGSFTDFVSTITDHSALTLTISRRERGLVTYSLQEFNSDYFLATMALAAALLAKPAAAAVPLLVSLWIVDCFSDRGVKSCGPRVLGWRWPRPAALTKCLQPGTGLLFSPPLWARPLLAGDTLAFYLWKLVAPWPLAPTTAERRHGALRKGGGLFCFPFAAALGVLLACLPRRRVWLVALGLFVAWLLPVSGLISVRLPAHFHGGRPLRVPGDARPSAGAGLAVGDALESLAAGGRGGGVRRAGRRWPRRRLPIRATPPPFSSTAATVNPASAAAGCCLGDLEAAAGRHAAAAALYRRAIGEHPDIVELHVALGNSLVALGKLSEARQTLAEAARRFSDSAVVEENLGHVCERLGRADEGDRALSPGGAAFTDDPAKRLLLGRLLESSGRPAEARFEYETGATLHPSLAAVHYRLGNLAQAEHNWPEAIRRVRGGDSRGPGLCRGPRQFGRCPDGGGKNRRRDRARTDGGAARSAFAARPFSFGPRLGSTRPPRGCRRGVPPGAAAASSRRADGPRNPAVAGKTQGRRARPVRRNFDE